MKKTSFTEEELIKMFRMYKNKEGVEYITEKLNTYPSFVKRQLSVLKGLIETDKKIPKTLNPKTLHVVEYFRNNHLQEKKQEVSGEKEETQIDNTVSGIEERFDKAFTIFQEAIVDLVVEMADRRAENIVKTKEEVIKQKEQELANQKEKYEQELLKMQAVLAEAKNSSITGLLKRKWTVLS